MSNNMISLNDYRNLIFFKTKEIKKKGRKPKSEDKNVKNGNTFISFKKMVNELIFCKNK